MTLYVAIHYYCYYNTSCRHLLKNIPCMGYSWDGIEATITLGLIHAKHNNITITCH